jgi:hypothetical protein
MVDDEPLEEAQNYAIFHKNQPATQPWIQKEHELRPKVEASGTVVVKSRNGDMLAPVPLLQKGRWQQIIFDSLPDKPLTVTQTGPREFRSVYADEEVLCHVKFMTDDEGEEHLVSLVHFWENQRIKIMWAFGREMVPDESRQSKDNVIYVRSADGSPPDPLFERTLRYTLGDGSEEFSIRVRKGQTTREVREGLKKLHAGINPSKILFENAEMDDEDPVTWVTSTGTSPIKVQIKLNKPMQKFWLWQVGSLYDLGSEELDGRSKGAIWQSLRPRNPLLKSPVEYKLFKGQ